MSFTKEIRSLETLMQERKGALCWCVRGEFLLSWMAIIIRDCAICFHLSWHGLGVVFLV